MLEAAEMNGAVSAPEILIQHSRPDGPSGGQGPRHPICVLQAAFPDLRFTIEDIIAEGDRVTTRGTLSGTNTGSLAGMPPTGKPVRVSYTDVLRLADGAFVEHWVQLDQLGLLRQLGAVPATGTAAPTGA